MSHPEQPSSSVSGAATSPTTPFFIGDPVDKATIRTLSRRSALPYVFMFLSFVGNLVQYLRNPEIITAIVTADGRRVVSINNREYGATEAVSYRPDKPDNDDKKYLVNEFTQLLFGIDPQNRKYQLEHAYPLLTSDFAAKYFNRYKASGEIDKQRDERWQAKWEIQKIEVDRHDPYLIHVIGTQDITRVVADKTEHQVSQKAIDFKLVDDSPRNTRNLRTGFLIAEFIGSDLPGSQPSNQSANLELPN